MKHCIIKVHEAAIKEIEAKAEKLTGKPNAKPRSELGKQVQAMKADQMYIDACKVVAEFGGLYATHIRYKDGFFVALPPELSEVTTTDQWTLKASSILETEISLEITTCL